jgi:hypothetical protein
MHIHLLLIFSLLAPFLSVNAVKNIAIPQIHIRQNNIIRRDPYPGKLRGLVAKLNSVIPKLPKPAPPPKGSASCGADIWFISERGGLKNQPYKALQVQARRCKERCHCETVAEYAATQLMCDIEIAVECNHFCTCVPDRFLPQQRPDTWGGSISSTTASESGSADQKIDNPRSMSSTGSWDTADSDIAEARKVIGGRKAADVVVQSNRVGLTPTYSTYPMKADLIDLDQSR